MPSEENSAAWTVLKILQWTAVYFKQHALDTPRIDAEVLLAHTLGCERIDLYLRHDQPLNEDELARFKLLIKRRLKREPVAYIVGYKEFWSLRFDVTPGVLIPRPDTECLVETALSLLPPEAEKTQLDLVELGTGSGAVVVALAHERPDCRYWATDASWKAAVTARNNADRNCAGTDIRFFMSCWLDAISAQRIQFDMVVSNPPYIRSDDIETLAPDIRAFEPIEALDGGPDGMKAIGAIVAQAGRFLKPGGHLLLEIGYDQRPAVQALVNRFDFYDLPVFHKDHGGHDRVVALRKK